MTSQPFKKVLLTIEGNIGGGKTTMIERLKIQAPHFVFIDEPVGEWLNMKNEKGESLLECFYNDKTRWSYTFQNCAFITRYLSSFEALSTPVTQDTIYISERGILTDRHVFAEMLKADGFLNEMEWNLYKKWFDHFSNCIKQDGIIYITTRADCCKDRIKIRARKGEESIPEEYLNELDNYHEKWINHSDLPVCKVTSDESNTQTIIDFANSLLSSKSTDRNK